MGQTTTVRAVDNSLVTLDLDGVTAEDLHFWNGHVRYIPRHGGRETTSDVWAMELAPKSCLVAGINSVQGKERERFAYNGGEVVIYDCGDDPTARWATWQGPWNMVHGLFYTPEWEANDVVKTLARVQWTDTPEGLIASPGRRFSLQRASYFQLVAGVGSLQVQPKNLATAEVPRWRGLSTKAGEVWRMSSAEGPQYESLMLVTDSAVVTLHPWDVPRRGQEAVATAAARDGATALSAAADFLSRVNAATWGA